MKSYLIGRNPDNDVMVNNDTVSGLHAELVIGRDGRWFLTDCGSSNGTYVNSGASTSDGGWERIRQSYVDPDAPLILGEYRTTPRQLLAMGGHPR